MNGNWLMSQTLLPTTSLINPYLYQLHEFTSGNTFVFAKEVRFVRATCAAQTLKSVSLSIFKILSYAPVVVTISSTTFGSTFSSVSYSSDSSIPVNFGGFSETLRVEIISKVGTKGGLFSPKERQVNVSFYVDGTEFNKGYYGCIGKNCNDFVITYTVDRTTGTISP